MNNPARLTFNSKGVTLIEMLIAVSIIAVITGAILPSFSNYITNQNLRQAQEQVKNDLRTAQNSALTGEGATTGVTYWGLRFTDQAETYNFVYYTGTTVPTNCTTNVAVEKTSTKLPGDVIIREPLTTCIFFSKSDGGAVAINTDSDIDLGYSTSTICSSVEVEGGGRILTATGDTCE